MEGFVRKMYPIGESFYIHLGHYFWFGAEQVVYSRFLGICVPEQ